MQPGGGAVWFGHQYGDQLGAAGARDRQALPPARWGGHKPKAISGEHREWLLQRVREKDFTIRGLFAEFAERGLKVDYRTVWNFIHAEGLSFKKKRVAKRRERPDIAAVTGHGGRSIRAASSQSA